MPETPEAAGGLSLRQRSASGVRWTALATGSASLLYLVQMGVLARFLTPAAFGLLAMAAVVTGFARAFADMGLSGAVIYRQTTTPRQLSSLFWVNLGAGAATFTVVAFSGPLAALIFRDDRLSALMPWVAVVFLAGAPGQLHQALLEKRLEFGRLAAVESLAAVVSTIASVALAWAGFDVYSLILGQALAAAVKSAGLLMMGWGAWRPSLHFRTRDLREYFGFGAYQVGERCVNYFSANVDYILVGRFLGPAALGVYSVAYQLAVFPLLRLNPVLTRVAFPVFARRQNDDLALRAGYLELTRALAFLAFPLLLGLAATAPQVICVAFGEQWLNAAPVLRVLAVLGLAKMLHNPVGALLLAKGRAEVGFWWNVGVAVINTLALWPMVRFGIVPVAATYAVLCVVYLLLNTRVLHWLIGLGSLQYLRALGRPALFASGMYAAVLGVATLTGDLLGSLPQLAILVLTGAAVYGSFWLATDPGFVRGLARLATARNA